MNHTATHWELLYENPILDTRKYIVQFNDGDEAELAANVIATNMYAQCDPEGNQ